MLTHTAWEVYVEDLLLEAIPVLCSGTSDQLSTDLRQRISERVTKNPWGLAGDGWQRIVQHDITDLSVGIAGQSWGINTANSKKVNEALRIVFGEALLDRCSTPGISAANNKRYLDQLVRRRGQIVHRGTTTDGPLGLGSVREWAKWVGQMADKQTS